MTFNQEETLCRQIQTQISRLKTFSDPDFFKTIVLGLNLLLFRYLSKFDAKTQITLYFKHIHVFFFSFLDFPGKLLLCGKS